MLIIRALTDPLNVLLRGSESRFYGRGPKRRRLMFGGSLLSGPRTSAPPSRRNFDWDFATLGLGTCGLAL